MTKILELYGFSTRSRGEPDWHKVIDQELCPYLQKKCLKTRKSQSQITIGTCSLIYGREQKEIIICPQRLLERLHMSHKMELEQITRLLASKISDKTLLTL